MKTVKVIGAGLAGTECAFQLAKRGFKVKLYEMKPSEFSPAHSNNNFAELVCSNSLRSNELTTAPGLLKEELRLLDSLVIKTADECRVPAGGALAVDRELFSKKITEAIKNNKNIEVIKQVRKYIQNVSLDFNILEKKAFKLIDAFTVLYDQ